MVFRYVRLSRTCSEWVVSGRKLWESWVHNPVQQIYDILRHETLPLLNDLSSLWTVGHGVSRDETLTRDSLSLCSFFSVKKVTHLFFFFLVVCGSTFFLVSSTESPPTVDVPGNTQPCSSVPRPVCVHLLSVLVAIPNLPRHLPTRCGRQPKTPPPATHPPPSEGFVFQNLLTIFITKAKFHSVRWGGGYFRELLCHL